VVVEMVLAHLARMVERISAQTRLCLTEGLRPSAGEEANADLVKAQALPTQLRGVATAQQVACLRRCPAILGHDMMSVVLGEALAVCWPARLVMRWANFRDLLFVVVAARIDELPGLDTVEVFAGID
jgi:hypothetical protein